MSRKLRYFNVVPLHGDDVKFAADEIRRQVSLGMDAVAIMLSYHPQCTPAHNLLPLHAERFRMLKDELKGAGVEVGVLVQSTAGHGWNGKVKLSNEPWQLSVCADGSVNSRYCQLDRGFRDYILEAVKSICREGPSFLLVDDDFGPRIGEGFCPLHVDLYNKAAGVSYTAEQWRELANTGDLSNPLRMKMEEARRRVPVEFAREIRAAIDSVDPSIRCGVCTPAKGMGFTREVALALAGPSTRPFIRICNSVYGMKPQSCFISQMQRVRQLAGMFEGVGEIVAEADTWPQNYWSEPARMFSAHLIFDILYGLDGAKIWMSEFERPCHDASQSRYEAVFRDEMPKRRALYEIMQTRHPKFHGVTGIVNWGGWVSDSVVTGGWREGTPVESVFATFGFPCEYAKAGLRDPRNVYALTRDSVAKMTNAEIRDVLSHRAFVDSIGAKELTRRGFAAMMGVAATDGGDDFFFNRELRKDGKPHVNVLWDDSAACLEKVADGVEVLAEYAYQDPFMEKPCVKAPSLTYFRNELGGEVAVAGWTYEVKGWMGWYKYIKIARKEQMVALMDRLSGGTMPYVAMENNHAISTWATLDDGAELVTVTNLAIDDWTDIRLHLDDAPTSAKLLMDNGEWKDVKAEKTANKEVVLRVGEVRCLSPQILLLSR